MSIDLQFVREMKSITLVVFCRQLDAGDQGRCFIFPIERLHLGATAEHGYNLRPSSQPWPSAHSAEYTRERGVSNICTTPKESLTLRDARNCLQRALQESRP